MPPPPDWLQGGAIVEVMGEDEECVSGKGTMGSSLFVARCMAESWATCLSHACCVPRPLAPFCCAATSAAFAPRRSCVRAARNARWSTTRCDAVVGTGCAVHLAATFLQQLLLGIFRGCGWHLGLLQPHRLPMQVNSAAGQTQDHQRQAAHASTENPSPTAETLLDAPWLTYLAAVATAAVVPDRRWLREAARGVHGTEHVPPAACPSRQRVSHQQLQAGQGGCLNGTRSVSSY